MRKKKMSSKLKQLCSHKTFCQRRLVHNNNLQFNGAQLNSFIEPYLIYEEKEHYFVNNMSRSPPPSSRSWYPPPGSTVGPAPMPSSSDRRSPGYDRPPPEWYRWYEQYRNRSPPRGGSPHAGHSPKRSSSPRRGYSPSRPPSAHSERTSSQRMPSPHIDRHGNSRRSPSPRQERPPSPRGDRSGRPSSPTRGSSPRRDRPPSPRRDRPLSPRRDRPPSPRRDRPPSPRRDRPRSPYYGWKPPRSPPRSYPAPDWGRRSRSPPPHWARRSPPRYGPLRGRSPPRSWGPPSEWDRYRGPPPPRSPPRWGPSGPPTAPYWDRRWPEPPPSQVIGPSFSSRTHAPPAQRSSSRKASPGPVPEPFKPDLNKADENIVPPGDEKDEEIDSFDLPDYDPDVPLGQKYVIAVSGFFCKICHKFYNSESSAKITHCKSRNHYDKFSKWLADKQVASLVQKRSATSNSSGQENKDDDEPPSKQARLCSSETEKVESQQSGMYDPSQPTTADVSMKEESVNGMENNQSQLDTTTDKTIEVEETDDVSDKQGNLSQTSEYNSDSETLITNETKKDNDGFIEATLYNLRKMKVNQLKANLEKRGLKSTGLKTLLLKRLEKVLLEEQAEQSEQNKEEEQKQNENQETDVAVEQEDANCKQYILKLLESDVEPNNRKRQWLTEKELEKELLQLDGVQEVNGAMSERKRVFNGRRTNVDWTIKVLYKGSLPEDGLEFWLPSHQQLAFNAVLNEKK
ncbi:uncharacterized protein LOC143460478 isoform X2 [Clavelina lepadiformis]|uniref:uncharacterized protein LOC143460478 isoform X2 n=1 Tax=Clavelina lepadiformis TaxID=159417 RepID=UPI004042ED0A